MKKLASVSLLVLLIGLVTATPVWATPPTEASGSFCIAPPYDGTVLQFFGTFDGMYVADVGPGKAEKGTFTGQADGQEGTAQLVALDLLPNGVGKWIALPGSGGLATLHGQGSYAFPTSPDGLCGEYWGAIHFDPSP